MRFQAPIRRVDTAKTHFYRDAAGARVPGVTTVLSGGLPKPALINWAANTTAEGALDAWDELTAMTPAKRLNYLKGVRYAEKDAAAKRGTEIHRFGEHLVRGESVDPPGELVGYVEGYARFLDAFKVEPVHVEFGVASYRHGYAGTCDLIADVTVPRIGKQRLLIDLKSSRSGLFGEAAAQLAAYRYADVILGDGDKPEIPMIEVDATAGVHIRPGGSDLIPVTTNEAVFRSFLYIAQVAAFEKDSRDLIGSPVAPDAESSYRLVREGS